MVRTGGQIYVISDPLTLDIVLDHCYDVFGRLYETYAWKVRQYPGAKTWWSAEIAWERSIVRSFRHRFKKERDPVERLVRRDTYCSVLKKYKCHIGKAKDSAIRKFCDENTRKFLFSDPYKLAFQKLRSVLSIPPLLCPDGTYTTSPEQSAGLLLRAQIRQDDPASDSEVHVRERELVSSPYRDVPNDVEFRAGGGCDGSVYESPFCFRFR